MKHHIYNQKKYKLYNHKLRWLSTEVHVLLRYDWKHTHVRETAAILAKALGRTPEAVARKVYSLGLHNPQRKGA